MNAAPTQALPSGIPSTAYISTGGTGSDLIAWWDQDGERTPQAVDAKRAAEIAESARATRSTALLGFSEGAVTANHLRFEFTPNVSLTRSLVLPTGRPIRIVEHKALSAKNRRQ
ncbi:hypothetical protein EON81_27325 [bacterium]|nr:MAG: hypothetical protein EON81_27325 [bacterium]